MPPRVHCLLLTSLHSLIIVAMLSGSSVPVVATAAPPPVGVTRSVDQNAPPVEGVPAATLPDATLGIPFDATSLPTPLFGPLLFDDNSLNPLPNLSDVKVPAENHAPPPLIEIPAGEASLAPPTTLEGIPLPFPDLLGEGIPTEVGRNIEPMVETTPSRVPIAISVEVDRYLLVQGEQATLRVKLGSQNMGLTRDVEVTLTLPPQLQIVGDAEQRKVWTYSPEDLAERVEHSFTVEANPAAELPAVVAVELSASASGYMTVHKQWLVGITGPASLDAGEIQPLATQTTRGAVVQSSGVTLLIHPNAAPTGTQIRYTPIFTPTIGEQRGEVVEEEPQASAIEVASANISSTTLMTDEILHLPAVIQSNNIPSQGELAPDSQPVQHTETGALPHDTAAEHSQSVAEEEQAAIEPTFALSPSISTIEDNGITMFRLWHLSADGTLAEGPTPAAENVEHPRFESPILMVVDASDLVASGVKMGLVV